MREILSDNDFGRGMHSRYEGQGDERPLSPEDLGDDDQPPAECNRKRGFDFSKTYGAVIDSYRAAQGLPPIETGD